MDANPVKFTKVANDSLYNLQAAIYRKALKTKITKNADYFIIAVDKTEPYHVSVMRATNEFIETGEMLLERLLNEFKEWNGEDIGYEWRMHQEVFDLDVPYWLKQKNETANK